MKLTVLALLVCLTGCARTQHKDNEDLHMIYCLGICFVIDHQDESSGPERKSDVPKVLKKIGSML